jgi:hypothetical protein
MHLNAATTARAKETVAADGGPGRPIQPYVPNFPRRHAAAALEIGDHVAGREEALKLQTARPERSTRDAGGENDGGLGN